MRVEESIEIDKPVEEVFDYLFEVDNFPEWSAPAIDVRKDAAETLKEGDTFTARRRSTSRVRRGGKWPGPP